MKNILPALLGMCCIFFTHEQTKAANVWGADISWTCRGNDTFVITVTAYGNCNGTSISPSSIILTPADAKCHDTTTFRSISSLTNGKDITPVCSRSCTRCSNSSCSFQFGVQQYNQTQTITFNANSCCKYEIEWDQCCRDTAMTTFKAGNFHINSFMNRCVTPCDNSPYFTSPPMCIVTANKPYFFNMGMADVDIDNKGIADSLSYHLESPSDSNNKAVVWDSGFSATNPGNFGSTIGRKFSHYDTVFFQGGFVVNVTYTYDGFYLDSLNGDIYFKATKPQTTAVCIQINEYKKDSAGTPYLAATIYRDMELIVTDSTPNHPPQITGINGTNSTYIDFCVDQYKCFRVSTYDPDSTDTVTLFWNNQIPGATFIVPAKNIKWPSGTFCWKPTIARSYPYYFTVSAKDNACPLNGHTNRTFGIIAHARPSAVYNATVTSCGDVSFSASQAGNSKEAISSYHWTGFGYPGLNSLSQNTTHKYRKAGTYPYTLTITSNNGCTYAYNDQITISPYVNVSLPSHDTTIKAGKTMTIKAIASLGKPAYSYSWNCSPSTNDSINFTFTKDTSIVVYVTDAQGCTNYDSMKVNVKPVTFYAYFKSKDNICIVSTISFTDASFGNIKKWNWDFGDGLTDSTQNPRHSYSFTGNYTVKLKVTNDSGKIDSFSKVIIVDSSCYADLLVQFFANGPFCINTAILFSDSSKVKECGKIKKWAWDFGDGHMDSIQNPTHTYNSVGAFLVKEAVYSSGGCKDSVYKPLLVDSCNTTIQLVQSNYFPIRLYPNPATNTLNIDAGGNVLNSATVFDAMGRQVFTENGLRTSQTSVPVSLLPSGIYILRLGVDGSYQMFRFMKE